MCVCVCVFQLNFGMPGVISFNLGANKFKPEKDCYVSKNPQHLRGGMDGVIEVACEVLENCR